MRFGEVVRYEIEYRLRRPLTWIFVIIQSILTLWVTLATFEESTELFNAPVRTAGGAAIAGMAGILISAALFGDAVLRDFEAEMDQLLFTSRLSKTQYLGGRFLAALAINAMIQLAIPLTQALATHLPFLKPEQVGPFHLAAHLQPFLLFQLPNLIFVGAILFTIAALTRQTIPVYLGAIGVFIAYLVAVNNLSTAATPMRLALGDPLGISVLQRLIRYWTPAESNARLVGFPAMLLLNRAIWLAAAGAILAFLSYRFRFAHHDGAGSRKAKRTIVVARAERSVPVTAPRVEGVFGRRTRIRQTLAVARHSLEEIAASRAAVATLLVAMGLSLLFGWNVGSTVFDTSTWPASYLVAEEVMTRRIAPVIALLIAVFAGELVWKDRAVDAAEITDAAPVAEGVLLAGRFLALVVMLAALHVAFMGAGILLQALQGYYRFEPGLYLKILFGVGLVRWILIGALAMAVHVIVNQKYLGHVVVILAFVFTMTANMFRIHHHLLIYARSPGWIYSEMNGFGPFVTPLVWFTLYWAAWALLLMVLANLFWVRGRETGLRRRLLEARARFAGAVMRVASVAVGLILLFGGFIFYNTNVLNDYVSPRDAGGPQAEYEKRYKRFENAPQPTITSVKLSVEIYPGKPAVDLRGSYRLVNRTNKAIDSVHVMFIDPGLEARSISFDRGSRPVITDDETHYRIYDLERPLEPGDSLELAFDVSFRPRGFTNDQARTSVVADGTSFNRSFLPVVGYQAVRELTSADTRERFGLPPRRDSRSQQYRWLLRNEDLVDVDAVIGTAADQIAVTSGVLRRSWVENGRRYFHYQSEPPQLFGADVFSAKWSVIEDRWNDVVLQIFHVPGDEGDNTNRTLRSMKTSLDYFTREYGPYPYSHLRIIEIPRYGGFGRAMANTISFTENYFDTRVEEGQVDMPFYGTAHEIAHQWWGGMVRGAAVPGHGLLSESLANYSAMILVEKTFGREAARKVYDFQMERYLRGRAEQSHEVPALVVGDQPYIAYRKGAIAMYTLREHIGEERVSSALRRFQAKYRGAGPPYPTSRDLYAELRAVTPDSLHGLLEDWFETVTIWDLKMERARFHRTASGEYVVTLGVIAEKGRADSLGYLKEVPMNDLVEIGVFAPAAGDGPGEPLYLRRHRIVSGKQTIQITVPRKPARAGIDPYHKLIDREQGDNVFDVWEDSTAAPPPRLPPTQ